ncbi:MAG TPA: hypothetical protein VMX33_11820 [bacterium]|nr:hypothetical protein [bacterium]
MKRLGVLLALLCVFLMVSFGQTISFGLGDAELDATLGALNVDAKANIGTFTAEVTLQWGASAVQVSAALSQGLEPAEIYLAAALAKLSGKSMDFVIVSYKNNRKAGWGALAKSLGIKPGSKQFKELKDKSKGSKDKIHKKK